MNGWIGVSGNDGPAFLSRELEIDEVNFWQPGGNGDRTRPSDLVTAAQVAFYFAD